MFVQCPNVVAFRLSGTVCHKTILLFFVFVLFLCVSRGWSVGGVGWCGVGRGLKRVKCVWCGVGRGPCSLIATFLRYLDLVQNSIEYFYKSLWLVNEDKK